MKLATEADYQPVPVDLRNRLLAGVLAWLWPGAGHLYQRRTGKGILYMTCLLGLFIWGFALGDGQVVYASFPSLEGGIGRALRDPQMRYPFLLQAGLGGPTLPAMLQCIAARNQWPPPLGDFMAAPKGELHEQRHDTLAMRHERLGVFFELGSLYTMIAGLLNVFVIYDACCGPAFPPFHDRQPGRQPS